MPASAGRLLVPEQYPSIGSAVAALGERDTVSIAPGIYSGEGNRNLLIGAIDVALIARDGPGTVEIDCEGSSGPSRQFLAYFGNVGFGLVLRDLTIRNSWHRSRSDPSAGRRLGFDHRVRLSGGWETRTSGVLVEPWTVRSGDRRLYLREQPRGDASGGGWGDCQRGQHRAGGAVLRASEWSRSFLPPSANCSRSSNRRLWTMTSESGNPARWSGFTSPT